jgi:hypothetical protein
MAWKETYKKDHKNVGKATIVIMSYSSNHPPACVVNEIKADQKLKINL